MDFNNENVSIYTCEFEALVERAKVQIKFPCNYFLQWKANNGKVIVSSPNRFQANKSQILFNQTLKITVNILYDKLSRLYLKKESLLMINLISKSRPDQVKLVGRVSVDLSDVLNSKTFQNITTLQLEYCSVEASINFCIKTISVKQSSIHVSELDRSSFNEYMSFQSNLKPQQGFMQRNQGSSTHRDFDDQRSAKGSDQGEIRSLGRDKSKMSSPSLMKTVYTPTNRQIIRFEGNNHQQNKVSRSNSVTNQLQNPNKVYPPPLEIKTLEPPLGAQSDSNFSFNNSKDNNISKSKMTTSQFVNNETSQKSAVNSKVRVSEPVLPQEFVQLAEVSPKTKDLKISVQKSQFSSQNMQRAEKSLLVQSPKQSQEDLLKRLKKQDEAISEREAVIRKLQNEVEIKRHLMPLEASFTSSSREANAKKLSAELSRTNSESKRIIGLTEALNELETKYTTLTLETQQMRSLWKRQKQELLSAVSIHEGAISFKDKEIREKAKVNEMLQYSLKEVEKQSNERLAEVIYVKSQLSESQRQANQLGDDKKKLEAQLRKMEDQIKFIQSQTSLSQDQLNRTFGDRLALYQEKITEAQNKLTLAQKQRKTLSDKNTLAQKEVSRLQEKIARLQEENKTYLNQIQNSHNELFGLKEENEGLRKQIIRKQRQSREQKEKIWSSKDEEVSHQLKLKNQQIDSIKHELSQKLMKVQNEHAHILQNAQKSHLRKIEVLKEQSLTLRTKIEELQNTILTLNDQLTNYQQKIHELSESVSVKTIKLEELSHVHESIDQEKRSMQGEHEELLLALNTQIQGYQRTIKSLEGEIIQIKQLLEQKENELLKSFEDVNAYKHQLQLTKAQTTIYESKIMEQREYYDQQTQSLRLEYSQHIYETEIHLQEQVQKYQELQHIKEMLKRSLQEWQNKCTDDRIASSKVVSKLNDIIKEKEETMYEMENIMRMLEKEKLGMQEHVEEQMRNYFEVLEVYQVKHKQMKAYIQSQEGEYIKLYQTVKEERENLKWTITEKEGFIHKIQQRNCQNQLKIQSLQAEIATLKESLVKQECLLIETNTISESKINNLKHEHNQQVDQYEERIRELQQKILQNNNELLDREMGLVQQEKIINQLKTEISSKQNQIIKLVDEKNISSQETNKLKAQIEANLVQKHSLAQKKLAISAQLQGLKTTLQNSQKRNSELETTLIEFEEKQKETISKILSENQELLLKISHFREAQDQSQLKINEIIAQHQKNFEKLQTQHQEAINQMISQENAKSQDLLDKISVLQEDKMKANELILEKTTEIQALNQGKSSLEQQIESLKAQRQTQVLLSYKEQIQKYKLQVKAFNEELLESRAQLKEIPALERTIKIKTIELNSLKYKSSTANNTPNLNSGTSQQLANLEEIIKLKNEEIQSLKKDNESMRHHELQLYQLQTLKEELYQSIEQYEEEKFHLSSELNEKEIKITELKHQLTLLVANKNQHKEKMHELHQKIHYYESLILDFKGHNEMSSTKSHSDKLNTSRISSGKVIETEGADGSNSNNLQNKLQLQTFIKKIKLLETQIQKMKQKEEEFLAKEQNQLNILKESEQKIKNLEQTIKQKEIEISKKSSIKPPSQPAKPVVTYKNPQQAAQTFKQIQTLLKKRSEFHNLESTLLKVHEINFKESIQSQKQDHETKQKLLTTGAHVSLLSKEFQNLKAKIMKLEGKNYQQKAKFIALLRPCEDSIKEVSKLYQNTDSSKHSSFQAI